MPYAYEMGVDVKLFIDMQISSMYLGEKRVDLGVRHVSEINRAIQQLPSSAWCCLSPVEIASGTELQFRLLQMQNSVNEDDIWSEMDTTAGAGSRSITPGMELGNEEAEISLQATMEDDSFVAPPPLAAPAQTNILIAGLENDTGPLEDENWQTDTDMFMHSMMSLEAFPRYDTMLSPTPAVRTWIHQQLHVDHNPYAEEHNRVWLFMCGETMDMDSIGCKHLAAAYEWWELLRSFAYTEILPISILLRAIDLFVVCKAVAAGLHEAPTIDKFGHMEDDGCSSSADGNSSVEWMPRSGAWQTFLPRFHEADFIEAALNVFVLDGWRRGCIPQFQLPAARSHIKLMQEKITDLLQLPQTRGHFPDLLVPTDAFTWRVIERVRERIAATVSSVLGHLLVADLESVIVGYTLDARTEADYYIGVALNGTADQCLGEATFIQTLHFQMEHSIYSFKPLVDDVQTHDWKAVSTGNIEDIGFTTDFLGSIFAPLADRIPRLGNIEPHRAVVKEVVEYHQQHCTAEYKSRQLQKVVDMDCRSRRRWRRELTRLANKGLDLITTWPHESSWTRFNRARVHLRRQILSMRSVEREELRAVVLKQIDSMRQRTEFRHARSSTPQPSGCKLELAGPVTPLQPTKTQSPFDSPPARSPSANLSDPDYSPSSQSSNNSDSDAMEFGV